MAHSQETSPFKTFLSAKDPFFQLSGNSITLLFTVANEGAETLKFCTYATPFEGLAGDILDITDANGKKVEYTGIMIKRGEPQEEDHQEVPAGTMVTAIFNLSGSYDFQKKGKYFVRFSGNEYMNGLPDSNVLEIVLKK